MCAIAVRGGRDRVGRAATDGASETWGRGGLGEWLGLWDACKRRFRTWRLPPRWSAGDWWEEVEALGLAAAWQALCEYDPGRGVPRAAFVRQRIRARVLTRYRQEWAYGRHCGPEIVSDGGGEWAGGSDPGAPHREEVRASLDRLPGSDRWLIEHLFLDGWTEAEVARALGINQSTVSKRKVTILNHLRVWRGDEE